LLQEARPVEQANSVDTKIALKHPLRISASLNRLLLSLPWRISNTAVIPSGLHLVRPTAIASNNSPSSGLDKAGSQWISSVAW
jgi:hypothetical protein